MLSDLGTLKYSLRITPSDSSQDTYLVGLLLAADRAAKLFTRRDLETNLYSDVYLDGPGVEDLCLPQRPVQSVASVYEDLQGFYGDGPNSFAPSTLLQAGVQYALIRDWPSAPFAGRWSKSGRVKRLGAWGNLSGGNGGWWDWPQPWARDGTLTARRAPVWPRGWGCLKVTFVAGYGQGADPPSATSPTGGTLPADTTLPYELTQAVNVLAAWARSMAPVGVAVNTGALSAQLADILNRQTTDQPELGTVRNTLAAYKERVI